MVFDSKFEALRSFIAFEILRWSKSFFTPLVFFFFFLFIIVDLSNDPE